MIFKSVREIFAYRQLIWEMAKREMTERYAGQILGIIWVIGHPLFLMAIYIFVFSYVFQVKAGGTHDLPLNYSVYLMAGLVPWLSYLESLSKASFVIVSNTGLVKQSVFPLEVLAIKSVIVSLITQTVGLSIVLGYTYYTYQSLSLMTLMVIPLTVIQLFGMIGFSLILSSVGVYFRDLKDFVQVLLTANMYIIPIFYLPTMVPEAFRVALAFNPFSHMVYCWQDVLYFGRFEHPESWALFTFGSFFTFFFGLGLFKKLKVMFGSAL